MSQNNETHNPHKCVDRITLYLYLESRIQCSAEPQNKHHCQKNFIYLSHPRLAHLDTYNCIDLIGTGILSKEIKNGAMDSTSYSTLQLHINKINPDLLKQTTIEPVEPLSSTLDHKNKMDAKESNENSYC